MSIDADAASRCHRRSFEGLGGVSSIRWLELRPLRSNGVALALVRRRCMLRATVVAACTRRINESEDGYMQSMTMRSADSLTIETWRRMLLPTRMSIGRSGAQRVTTVGVTECEVNHEQRRPRSPFRS